MEKDETTVRGYKQRIFIHGCTDLFLVFSSRKFCDQCHAVKTNNVVKKCFLWSKGA